MPNARGTRWGVVVGATLALAGCASQVGNDPTPSSSPEGSSTAESTAGAEHAISTETALRPLTSHDDRCCSFPTAGGGWQDNPLQDALLALGCSTPAPYAQTEKALWLWTQCPLNFPLVGTVFEYAGTPYDAHFVINPCLDVQPGNIAVVFDPTCPTCIRQASSRPSCGGSNGND